MATRRSCSSGETGRRSYSRLMAESHDVVQDALHTVLVQDNEALIVWLASHVTTSDPVALLC